MGIKKEIYFLKMKGSKIKGTKMSIGEYLYPRRQENTYTSYSNVVSNITYCQILRGVDQLRTMREDEERRKEEEECSRAIREAEETQRIRMEEENKTWTRVSGNSRKK